MKHRSPIAVFIFGFITGGIYSLYWNIVTKIEMNERGATIPTAWFIIIPFVNIWWLWKYSEGVEKVTGGKLSGVLAFLLLLLLGPIGDAVVQDSFNHNVVATDPGQSAAPVAPVSSAPPEATAVPPANPEPPVTTPPPPSAPVS